MLKSQKDELVSELQYSQNTVKELQAAQEENDISDAFPGNATRSNNR